MAVMIGFCRLRRQDEVVSFYIIMLIMLDLVALLMFF